MKWYILPHGNMYRETIWEVTWSICRKVRILTKDMDKKRPPARTFLCFGCTFKLCPLHCFRKRYVVKMSKNEGANVSRCYVPNLRRFWIVKFSFLTLWPATRVKSSSHAEFYRTLPSITKPISEV